jgi:ParB/RepB/Spo0J family partition protein
MKQKVETVLVPLASIQADANQPRKNFNPERLSELMASIKKYGIINPLVLELVTPGKYQLVDGERRFRAATELKLKEVPAVVRVSMDETERLIQQFHIQEQHEGWSPVEKASAVARLAEKMKIGVRQMAQTLSLSERSIADYTAFAALLERKEFQKNEIPIHFASAIIALRNFTKRQWLDVLKKDFDEDMQRDLEKAIIVRIKHGSISKKVDILKLRDSIKMEPKSATTFINDTKLSVSKLFIDSKAETAQTYRRVMDFSAGISSYAKKAIETKASKLFNSEDDAPKIRRAYNRLGELLREIA